ncbi:MAG: FliI/YscN family ATPase [Pseudomonadota bacterium]
MLEISELERAAERLEAGVAGLTMGAGAPARVMGKVSAVADGGFRIRGVAGLACVGDAVRLYRADGRVIAGEIVGLAESAAPGAAGGGRDAEAIAMAFGPIDGAAIGDRAEIAPQRNPRPSDAWLGQVIDAHGAPAGGGALPEGSQEVALRAGPPPAFSRRGIGARLRSGHAPLDTLLPICRGQRLGVFAGSGVGKSRLMGALAQRMETDVAVIGLIGERGREVRDFVENIMGPEAMSRAVVVAATSDQPAAVKRRAAWLTLATAEYFRDQGRQVLLLFDSLTRFAEAHREVALTSGENAPGGGFPPSTTPSVAALAERAGPGGGVAGDITAIFTVLVAGSDMEEPVADMTRGILDGHIILNREIAERGRFPAIDVRRSVSRALPEAATEDENALIAEARRLLAVYEQAEPMIQIGLYQPGADPEIDRAAQVWPALDAFFAAPSETPEDAFQHLRVVLGHAPPPPPPTANSTAPIAPARPSDGVRALQDAVSAGPTSGTASD